MIKLDISHIFQMDIFYFDGYGQVRFKSHFELVIRENIMFTLKITK